MTLNKIKFASQKLLKIFAFTFVFIYFGYHLISGQNGIISYMNQKNQLKKLNIELASVEQKRQHLQNKVQKLYAESLDADLLDEQYRRTTGKIKPNESIYYYEN